MTYLDWAALHSNLFAMTTDRQAQMLADWASLFESEGFTPEELKLASRKMASSEVKLFPGEHINRITEIIRGERRKKQAREIDPGEGEGGRCVLCMGCGIAAVPGAGCLTIAGNRIDDDSKQTIGVCCSCIQGKKVFAESLKGERPMRTLGDYEREYPRWRIEMDEQRKREARRSQLLAESARDPGSVIASLSEKFGLGDR